MLNVILDTLIDSLKMLPFLFISYLIIEFIEHKSSKKIEKVLSKSGKYGPIIGSLLGVVPQCGFSVTASNLYAGRVITLGTLIAVFLSTSDEAIPVLLSSPGNFLEIFKIIAIKFIAGILIGTIIDYVMRKKYTLKQEVTTVTEHIHTICTNCDCEHEGLIKPSIKHTLSTFLFIVIVSFLLNILIYFIGPEKLETILLSGSVFQPIIAGLIGLIPNCASSILLTELYLSQSISFASVIAGLSTSAGIGLIILFKSNKNLKENLKIVSLLYLSGVTFGIILEFLAMII